MLIDYDAWRYEIMRWAKGRRLETTRKTGAEGSGGAYEMDGAQGGGKHGPQKTHGNRKKSGPPSQRKKRSGSSKPNGRGRVEKS